MGCTSFICQKKKIFYGLFSKNSLAWNTSLKLSLRWITKYSPTERYSLNKHSIIESLFFQVLEVNGQSFEHGTRYGRALEILKGVCHLSITVKSNLLAFQEMLQTPEDTPRSRSRGKSTSGRIEEFSNGSENSGPDGRSSSLSTVNSTGNSRWELRMP